MQFDWDDGNTAKCARHGLTRDEIEYALTHNARFAPDVDHSLTEQRFLAISRTAQGRPVVIVFAGGTVASAPSAPATCI